MKANKQTSGIGKYMKKLNKDQEILCVHTSQEPCYCDLLGPVVKTVVRRDKIDERTVP